MVLVSLLKHVEPGILRHFEAVDQHLISIFYCILLSGPGERLLVVGPSGCGKTSVLRVASGLWEPTMGSVKRQGSSESRAKDGYCAVLKEHETNINKSHVRSQLEFDCQEIAAAFDAIHGAKGLEFSL